MYGNWCKYREVSNRKFLIAHCVRLIGDYERAFAVTVWNVVIARYSNIVDNFSEACSLLPTFLLFISFRNISIEFPKLANTSNVSFCWHEFSEIRNASEAHIFIIHKNLIFISCIRFFFFRFGKIFDRQRNKLGIRFIYEMKDGNSIMCRTMQYILFQQCNVWSTARALCSIRHRWPLPFDGRDDIVSFSCQSANNAQQVSDIYAQAREQCCTIGVRRQCVEKSVRIETVA